MCPCRLWDEYVCEPCTDYIEDLFAALLVAERRGDDDQRSLRGEVQQLGLKAEIVRLRMEQRKWEARNAA